MGAVSAAVMLGFDLTVTTELEQETVLGVDFSAPPAVVVVADIVVGVDFAPDRAVK